MVADRPCHHGGNTGTEGRTVGGPESGKRTIEDLALGRVSTILEVRSFTFLAIRALQSDRYWRKRIDLFAFGISYNDPQHGGTPLYNGNISETEWKTDNTDSSLRYYRYDFDGLNRLIGARDNIGDYNLGVYDGSGNLTGPVGYDKNGNVTGLTRKGHLDIGGTTFGNMDVLGYVYDSGNKVLRIDDSGSDAQGFRDGTNVNDDFEYDGNGNLKVDRNKGITSITYNHLNMPTLVDFGATGNIEMVYAADGTKLKKTASNGTVTEYFLRFCATFWHYKHVFFT